MRLIDADYLKEQFPDEWNYDADHSIFRRIEKIIDNAPTVTAFEYEHAEFKKFYADIKEKFGRIKQCEQCQCNCDICEYKKFTVKIVERITDEMIKIGFDNFDDFYKHMKEGGEE